MLRVPRILLCLVVAASPGCSHAINYTDPSGPVLTGQEQTAPTATGTLTVVTFNIRFGQQVSRAIALLETDPTLRHADIVLLQEMDAPGTQEVARRLAMNYVYVPSAVHPRTRRDMGVAILSPWPIEDPHKVPLPHAHVLRRMQRSVAAGTIRAASATVRVYAVHLETPFGASDAMRRAQARAVLADAASWDGPLVIAGDFNGTDGALELASHGLTWLTRRVHDTAGPFDFDHIVSRGLCLVAGPGVVRTPAVPTISDHRPVWVTVRTCQSRS